MIQRSDAQAMSPDVREDRAKPWPPRLLFCLMAVAAGSLVLRLYRLDAESLYMDEITTAETFYRDPWGIVMSAAQHGQPPLDNFIGAALARVGLPESDWWVRLPAAVFGAGGVLLLGLLVAGFAGRSTGLAAAMLLGVCPMHVYVSQEVRPYALMFFLALAAVLAFGRARTRNTKQAWLVFAATSFLMLMTRWTDPHFVVLGLAAYACTARLRVHRLADPAARVCESLRFRRTVISLLTAYVLYAPFFVVVFQQCRRAIHPQSGVGLDRFRSLLSEGFAALFAGYSTRTVFSALPGATWLVLLAGLFTLVGASILLLRAARHVDRGGLFLSVFIPFPFAYALAYSLAGNAIPKPQYMLLGAVAVLGCMSVAMDGIRQRLGAKNRMLGAVAFVALIALFAGPMASASWAALDRVDKRDWRGAMGYLKVHARPGDAAASAGSDTIPPAFGPLAFGKPRYGPEYLKFVPIALATALEAFNADAWRDRKNTVWLLVYTDRMYLGYDQVPAPAGVPGNMAVHSFHGLFLIEVHGDQPAVDRLMDGIAALYEALPDGRSLIAPAVLRSRWLMSLGDTLAAETALKDALRQCRSAPERQDLGSP